jgi:hypothetical protein
MRTKLSAEQLSDQHITSNIGGLNKAHRVIRTYSAIERTYQEFEAVCKRAHSLERSQSQRDERRAKR